MTLATNDREVTYSPVSSTDTFAVDFPIFDDDHLRVLIDGVETLNFSVTSTYEDGRSEDAEVVLDTPVSGVEVVIRGQITVERSADYSGGTPNLARNLQNDMDFITAVSQELRRDYAAALLNVMPGEVMVSTFMEEVLDDANGDAALTTLGLTTDGLALVKASDYAAMRTALSLGSLALLSSIGLSNITAGDRPDDDDLTNDGTKLALRKNVAEWSKAPWELVETIATTSGTTFTVPSSGTFEDGYDVVLEFVEVEQDSGANRRIAFDLYGATDGAYTGSPQSMSQEVNSSGYFGLLRLPDLLRSAAQIHPLTWTPTGSTSSTASNFIDSPANQYDRNFFFATGQKIDRLQGSLNGSGNFNKGAVRYWRKRS